MNENSRRLHERFIRGTYLGIRKEEMMGLLLVVLAHPAGLPLMLALVILGLSSVLWPLDEMGA